MVKLEALGQAQVHQHHAARGHEGVAVHKLYAVSQLLREPVGARGVGGDDSGEALLARSLLGNACQLGHVAPCVAVRHLHDARRRARALHRGEARTLVQRQQAREQLRYLRARTVAREKLAGLDLAMRRREDLAHLVEARCALADGLVLVAQQHEVGAREVARQHHELRHGVVLNLVHHHVARGLLATAHNQQLEVDPLGRRERALAQYAHANAVDAQPVAALYLIVRPGEEVPHVGEGVGRALLVIGGAYRLAKDLDLLLHVQAEHLLPDLLALGKRRELAVKAVVQLVLHEGGEARSHGNLRELGNGARHRGRLEHHALAAANLAQVVGLKRHRAHALLQALELCRVAVAPVAALGEAQAGEKTAPREDARVLLAHAGQHRVDVVAEDVVGREEEDLVGREGLALLVEEVRHALQQHRGLARAGDAAHEQHGHVLVADDRVLLALDGCGDGRELLGVVLLERAEKERVLDGHGGVEVRVELVARDIELSAQQQVDGAGATVHLVGGGAHLLVVVGLGHGAAPVHDERALVLVGHARGANVDVARRAAGAHLERDFGEVGLAQQQEHALELLDGEVVVLVVRVDDRVERLDGGEGLHGLVGAAKVGANLLAHLAQVVRRALVACLDVLGEGVPQVAELGVYRPQVVLLLAERIVVRLVCHASSQCPARKRDGLL